MTKHKNIKHARSASMEYRGSNAGTDDISADRMKRQRSVEPVFNRRQASSSESSDSESEAAGAVALPDQPLVICRSTPGFIASLDILLLAESTAGENLCSHLVASFTTSEVS